MQSCLQAAIRFNEDIAGQKQELDLLQNALLDEFSQRCERGVFKRCLQIRVKVFRMPD